MNGQRLRRALKRLHGSFDQEQRLYGIIGRPGPGGAVEVNVVGRANYIYLSLRNANGGQTSPPARNDVGVPLAAGAAVEYRVEGTTHVIVAKSGREDISTSPSTPPSGVPVHIHDTRYFTESEHINVSAGAADAGKPIKLDAAGHVDATMINDGDIDHTLITNIGTNTHAQIDTHIAATAAHGATGAIVGTTNVQTLSSKTLTAPTIADYTNAGHDHADADDGGTIAYASLTGTPTITAYALTLLDDANIAAAQATLALVPGTNVQAFDAELAAIAGLTSAADRLAYFTGSGTAALATFSSYGRTLAALADAAALRTNINVADGADVTASAITALATKTTPVDADAVVITDSAASDVPKRTLWSNIKATLKTYFDTLYVGLTGNQDIAGSKKFTSNVEVEATSATLTLDATTGAPGVYLQEAGTTKWRFVYDAGGNLFTFSEFAVADWLKIYDGTGVTLLAGNVGVGTVTTPQGKLHAHDGTGGVLFVSKTAVAGTKVVIIPDATGDVTSALTCMYVLSNSDGTETGSTLTILNPGSSAVTIGGTTWTFTVAANGEFSVIRTAGTDTATIVMQIVWR